jgi:DNA transposition AAA+ family ATPase
MPSQTQSLQLETHKLQHLFAAYPEEIRDDCLWLGAFLREHCSRNLTALETLCRKRGFDLHETTLSRILRGKLFNDDGAPLLKLSRLSALIAALRQEDQLARLAGRVAFIETPTWESIRDYVDFKRAPETVCKFGLIIGPTGSQKSCCAKHYAALNNHGVVVHLETPETPTMGRFVTKLAVKYGVSEFHNIEKKRERITEAVTDRSCIIVDNIQRMYKDRHGWSQPVFNFLQQLQDDTGCTVILICVPEFEATLSRGADKGYFEQFEGRVGGRSEFLWLPAFPPREDVLAIAQALKLRDAEKHLDELEAIARERGRVRILFNALQKATRLAHHKPLTIRHVRAALNREEGDE